MPRVTDIFRHPLKSHGREALQRVTLSQGGGHALGSPLGSRP